jgi:hypothetical protein
VPFVEELEHALTAPQVDLVGRQRVLEFLYERHSFVEAA